MFLGQIGRAVRQRTNPLDLSSMKAVSAAELRLRASPAVNTARHEEQRGSSSLHSERSYTTQALSVLEACRPDLLK